MKKHVLLITIILCCTSLFGCSKKELTASGIYEGIVDKKYYYDCVNVIDNNDLFLSAYEFSVLKTKYENCKTTPDFKIIEFSSTLDARVYKDVLDKEKDYVYELLKNNYDFSETFISKNLKIETEEATYKAERYENIVIETKKNLESEISTHVTEKINKIIEKSKKNNDSSLDGDYETLLKTAQEKYYSKSKNAKVVNDFIKSVNEQIEKINSYDDLEITNENHTKIYDSVVEVLPLLQDLKESESFSEKASATEEIAEKVLSSIEKIQKDNIKNIERKITNVEKTLNYDAYTEVNETINNYGLSSLYSDSIKDWNERISKVKSDVEEKKKFDDFKADCISVSYEELMRYSDTYKTQKIAVSLYISEVEPDGLIFDGTIWAKMAGQQCVLTDDRSKKEPKILTGDRVTVYGYGAGLTKVKRYLKGTGILGTDLFATTISEWEVPVIKATYVVFK